MDKSFKMNGGLKIYILVLNVFLVCGQDILFMHQQLVEGDACETNNGEPGICLKANKCTQILGSVKNQKICSFNGHDAIVCYKRSNLTIIPGNDGEYSKKDLEKAICVAKEVCDSYYVTFGPPQYSFIGGKQSIFGAHPHMAAIGWTEPDGTISWDCGGSYIEVNIVITAAHCTWKLGNPPDIVRVGDVDLTAKERYYNVFDYNISEIIIHPKYRSAMFYYDIAILRLTPRENYPSLPRPICLWAKSDLPVSRFLAMGYGTTSFAGEKANKLIEGNLDLVDVAQCKESYEISNRLPSGIIDMQICASDPEGKSDTCQGDSGGPLQFAKEGDRHRRIYLAGITSFGQFCAGASPGVYTKVASHITWIADVVWL